MKTILFNDSDFKWTVPVDWQNHTIIAPHKSIEVESGKGSIYEPYSELKRYFTSNQLFDGERNGRWYYEVSAKKAKGYSWKLNEEGAYDVILENNGDFEIEIFKFNLIGTTRHQAPAKIKCVIRDVSFQHWLSRIMSIEVRPQRQMVRGLDHDNNPIFSLVPDVRYNRRSKEDLMKLEEKHLAWRKKQMVVSVA